jgi:hypothetical protein
MNCVKSVDNKLHLHDVEPEYVLACLLLESGGEIELSVLWDVSNDIRKIINEEFGKTHIYFSDISRDSVTSTASALHDYFELTESGLRSRGKCEHFFNLLKHNTAPAVANKISESYKNRFSSVLVRA